MPKVVYARPDPHQPQSSAAAQPRLLDRVCEKCRLLHYSKRTEEAYVGWIRKFILFLYKLLEQPLPLLDAVRAKRPDRLPTVLSVDEVRRLFEQLPQNITGLMAELLYGTGMRLLECSGSA